jgi:hypothetical protein
MNANYPSPFSHADLIGLAERWLRAQGCKVVFCELTTINSSGEIPDAIGWLRTGTVLVECKTSRADFLADARKPFRRDPARGMGDWRYYLCPPHVIRPADLPRGWGLLWPQASRMRRVVDPGSAAGILGRFQGRPPFDAAKDNETAMLVSALRRLDLRGRLPEIYEPLK